MNVPRKRDIKKRKEEKKRTSDLVENAPREKPSSSASAFFTFSLIDRNDQEKNRG